MPETLTVLILTLDEARHIVRAIDSVRAVAARIVVVDSGSTDGTRELAAAAGAAVFQHPFSYHAAQVNWALENTGITTGWTLRLDADEIALPELAAAIPGFIAATAATGVTVNRRIHFLGRWLRRGGVYPVRTLRLWRTGYGRCEDRWMDEHMVVDGPVAHLDADIADINLNTIGWWTAKHNGYATREAVASILADGAPSPSGLARQARGKRWVKHNLYGRVPLGLRALSYFIYRYVLRLGFLDGWQGLVFCALQGGWYRFLVDVKITELRGLMRDRGQSLAEVVHEAYGLKL